MTDLQTIRKSPRISIVVLKIVLKKVNNVRSYEHRERDGFKGSGSYLGQLLRILGLLADERDEVREGVVTILGVLDHPRGGRVLRLVVAEPGHTLTGTTGQPFVRRVQS